MKNMEVDPRLKCKYRRGQRIRLRAHVKAGGGHLGTFGWITEVRQPFAPRPYVLARLCGANEIVGLHPEDFVVVEE
jgi:hypothetical protein